jgi:hypothetical protein
MLEKLILKLTHKMWNRHISRILCRAKADGVINSNQLHKIAAAFDPTQKHMVYGANTGRGFIPILKVAILLCIVGCGEGRNISKPSPEIQARAKVYSTSFSREVAAIEKIDTVANKQDVLSTQVDSFTSKSIELNQEIVEQLKALNGSIFETRRAVGTMEASLVKPQTLRNEEVIKSALEPQEAAKANQSQSHQPVASPPAVRLFVSHAPFYCPPCERLKTAVANGEFDGFVVEDSGDFPGLRSYPAIRFQTSKTRTGWGVVYGYDSNTIPTLRALTEATLQRPVTLIDRGTRSPGLRVKLSRRGLFGIFP